MIIPQCLFQAYQKPKTYTQYTHRRVKDTDTQRFDENELFFLVLVLFLRGLDFNCGILTRVDDDQSI